MKKSEIRVGARYVAKISNKLTTVTVREIGKREKNRYRSGRTVYYCINDNTGREVTIKSAMKFRREVLQPLQPSQEA